jgi:PAS domain S-box-containing protein
MMPGINDYSLKKNEISSYAEQQLPIDEEHVVEMHDAPAFLMNVQGIIRSCNKSAERRFGYPQSDLLWQHISCLFPQFADVELVMQNHLNPLLNYLCRCDHIFEAINKKGEIISCNLTFFSIEREGMHLLRLVVRSSDEANS